MAKIDSCSVEDQFYGTATVGERGQIVIPAEARKDINIHPGDKLLIWKHPSDHGLMLFKIDSMREFMARMMEKLERAEQAVQESPTEARTPDAPETQTP